MLFARSGQSCIPCGGAVSVPLGNTASASFASRGLVFAFAFCFCAPGRVQQLCACAAWQFSSPAALALGVVTSAAIAFMLLQPNKQPPAIHTDTLTARSKRVILMKKADSSTAVYSPRGPLSRNPRLRKTQKHKDRARFT